MVFMKLARGKSESVFLVKKSLPSFKSVTPSRNSSCSSEVRSSHRHLESLLNSLVYRVHLCRRLTPKAFQGFPEKLNPGIDISGTVVAVNHGNRLARRCRNHVYLSVPFEFFVSHDHGEVAGARAHIAGLHADGIGRDHTGSGVSLAGSNGNPRFQLLHVRNSQSCQLSLSKGR